MNPFTHVVELEFQSDSPDEAELVLATLNVVASTYGGKEADNGRTHDQTGISFLFHEQSTADMFLLRAQRILGVQYRFGAVESYG